MGQHKAYSKINLFLEIGDRRSNGKHDIQTVFCKLALHDLVTLKETGRKGILIEGFEDLEIPQKENIMYEAALRMADAGNVDIEKDLIHIIVEKHIPLSAGLMGGSTDAASVLRALNERWELFLSEDELIKIASGLGADVAIALQFTKQSGVFKAEGVGDRIKRIGDITKKEVLIAIPTEYFEDQKTKTVYDLLDKTKRTRRTLSKMKEHLEKGNWKGIGVNLYNAFERVAFEEYPVLKDIKKKMMRHEAYGALMSGAGGAVFGIFPDIESADNAEEKLKVLVEQGKIKRLIRTTTL